jgi:hypothetical protein
MAKQYDSILRNCRTNQHWNFVSNSEQLGISREQDVSIIHENLDMRKLSAKWVPKCLKADKKHQRASHLNKLWNFFGAIQMISCRNWWPWTKPGYITTTRRQSNNQWSVGIAAHPSPNKSECKNPLENSRLDLCAWSICLTAGVIYPHKVLNKLVWTHLCTLLVSNIHSKY